MTDSLLMGPHKVACPVSGCDYIGPPTSVAGHVSGKQDTDTIGNLLDIYGFNQKQAAHHESSLHTLSESYTPLLRASR